MKTRTICAIPWMHLNFEPNGKVVPCCLTSTHNYFAGDLTTDSIEEIWNSDNMKSLRLQMVNGEEPKICSTCFNHTIHILKKIRTPNYFRHGICYQSDLNT